MKLKEYINEYIASLSTNDININDIYFLLTKYFNVHSGNEVRLNYNNKELDISEMKDISSLLNRYYIQKEPLQYIIGYQNFYNEKYIVNSNVLIPRSDTELLVDEAIKLINKYKYNSLIDMCTGSGAVGISIANNSNIEKVYLADISKEALEVTKENVILNNVINKCTIIYSNLFNNLSNKVDIIVSNPPYIKTSIINELDIYVKKEPILALDGGADGLKIYTEILNSASNYIKDNGYILFEIGYDQKEDLINLISQYNHYEYIDCKKDIEDRDRVIICRFHQN